MTSLKVRNKQQLLHRIERIFTDLYYLQFQCNAGNTETYNIFRGVNVLNYKEVKYQSCAFCSLSIIMINTNDVTEFMKKVCIYSI